MSLLSLTTKKEVERMQVESLFKITRDILPNYKVRSDMILWGIEFVVYVRGIKRLTVCVRRRKERRTLIFAAAFKQDC